MFFSLEMTFFFGWFWFDHRHQIKDSRAFRVFYGNEFISIALIQGLDAYQS